MSKNGPLKSPAARPTGPAAKVDPTPARLAAEINVEAQTAQFTDDGTSRWGIVRYDEGERAGWVRTGLTFADAKNIALDFNSNASDLGIEYRVERELDPGPEFEEITIAGPIIRATSGTVLWDTQTQQNVLPRREVTVRVPVVSATRTVAPRPTPLELEEQAHAQFRETANAIIADLHAQVEKLQGALEMKCQDEADALAALAQAQQQITELQSRPAGTNLIAAPNDALTLAYLRAWYDRLSTAERDAQPTLIHDLVVRWDQRGRLWHQVVMRCEGAKIGKTPYEMSPPKKVHKGQGAIQPKPAA